MALFNFSHTKLMGVIHLIFWLTLQTLKFDDFFPVSSVSAFTAEISPLPLPIQGSCVAGTNYTIKSITDLYSNFKDLECIFAAGLAPENSTVPLGYNYGNLISVLNTAFWSPIANVAYQGDYVVKTQCNQTNYNIGWLSVGGIDVGTAVWYAGDFPLQNNLATGEYPLGTTGGIVMDFTVDFRKLCPVEGNESWWGLKNFRPFDMSLWPINQFIDYSRVVGRDISDGGLISLNKAYIIPKDPLTGASTVLFYSTKSFDPQFMPNFAPNGGEQQIVVPIGPNGETEIFYNRGGIEEIVPKLNPNDIFKDARSKFDILWNYWQASKDLYLPDIVTNTTLNANIVTPILPTSSTTSTASPTTSLTTSTATP